MIVSLLTSIGLSQRIARIAAPVISVVAAIALVWGLLVYIGHIKDQRDMRWRICELRMPKSNC